MSIVTVLSDIDQRVIVFVFEVVHNVINAFWVVIGIPVFFVFNELRKGSIHIIPINKKEKNIEK